jgi:molybdenum cofactor cytidylyltransferase
LNQNKEGKTSVAAIILAAGASRRMGRPKQLLPYRGQTLLSYVIQCAIASSCSPVIVILGANAEQIEPKISRLTIKIVKNTEWNEGISSSIRCGITYIQEQFLNIDAVVFLTCDQPFVSPKIIEQLIDVYYSTNQFIIASSYNRTTGIPALFTCHFFSKLMELQGDRGAKKLIHQYHYLVQQIDFPRGAIDLDTLENYQKLISRDDLNY